MIWLEGGRGLISDSIESSDEIMVLNFNFQKWKKFNR